MTGIIITALTVVGSIGTSWLTANTRIAVVEERENNHYSEVQKQIGELNKDQGERFEDLNKRLDEILKKR